MYITSTEYNSITGRPAAEATDYRIKIASKMLDRRIGNYLIFENGYKIDSSNWEIWVRGVLTDVPTAWKEAVQIWVCQMVSFLTDNNNNPSINQNVKLGRFSSGKISAGFSSNLLPDEMSFVDSILIGAGIINRKVKMT